MLQAVRGSAFLCRHECFTISSAESSLQMIPRLQASTWCTSEWHRRTLMRDASSADANYTSWLFQSAALHSVSILEFVSGHNVLCVKVDDACLSAILHTVSQTTMQDLRTGWVH